jgi:4-hydroxy-2-oxoheptanedioate aldolase
VLAGESLLGCFLTWPAPGIADLAALAGFDFLVLDTEHGFLNPESVEHMVLDGGAAGILFPRADGLPAVRGAIESVKYAPSGRRGLGGVRANRYGDEPLDRFVRRANEETLVAIQIETRGALEELPQIAVEPAVDLLFVGPNDLSQALEIPGKTSDPRFLEAVARVAAEAGKAGKAAGVMVSRREDLPRLPEQGYRIFATSDRALVLESGRNWRQALGVRR